MKDAIIIGIDPGSINFGYSVIQTSTKQIKLIECNVIKCNTKDALNERIGKIYHNLHKIFSKFNPSIVSIEDIFYHKNIKSAITLAHSRSIGILMASIFNCKLLEYSPRKIKLSIAGNGSADKIQVRSMVARILSVSEKDLELDASDACAIALCSYYDMQKPFTKLPASKSKWNDSTLKNCGFKIVGGT